MGKPYSFLKWAGGKSKLVPILNSYLGNIGRLVEPFCGSGSVFMGSGFNDYLLSDNNPDLIGLFNNIKNNSVELIGIITSLFVDENNTEEKYYNLREEFNQLDPNNLRKSALFVYLNRHCFNGLCRYNKKGQYNVPYGGSTGKRIICPIEGILDFYQKIINTNTTLMCSSFENIFDMVQVSDVVYCDPPYSPISKTSNFTSYSSGGFDDEQHVKLVERAELVSSKLGVKVIISNHDTEFTREIYKNAKIIELSMDRSISCKSSSRGKCKELIAIFE